MRTPKVAAPILALLATIATTGVAQPAVQPVALASPAAVSAPAPDLPHHALLVRRAAATANVGPGTAPWWAPAASLILPGAGQFALGQQRSVAYLVAEAYLVLQAVAARRDGDRARDEYRAIASDVARRPFSEQRPVGSWAYYEVMSEQLESGQFDRVPGGAVDPETNEATYNGASWRLARETFWNDPDTPPPVSSAEYQRALAFYESRAFRDEYRWSWRDAQLERGVYTETINAANRSYQRSVNLFSLVGANHLTSLVDAYVTVRIRRFGGVRVGSLTFDRIQSGIEAIGDPADGRYRVQSGIRFVPAPTGRGTR